MGLPWRVSITIILRECPSIIGGGMSKRYWLLPVFDAISIILGHSSLGPKLAGELGISVIIGSIVVGILSRHLYF